MKIIESKGEISKFKQASKHFDKSISKLENTWKNKKGIMPIIKFLKAVIIALKIVARKERRDKKTL